MEGWTHNRLLYSVRVEQSFVLIQSQQKHVKTKRVIFSTLFAHPAMEPIFCTLVKAMSVQIPFIFDTNLHWFNMKSLVSHRKPASILSELFRSLM